MIDLDKMIEAQAKEDGTVHGPITYAGYKHVGTYINANGAYKIEEGIGELLINRQIAMYFTSNHSAETTAFVKALKFDKDGKFIDP